MWLGRPAVRPPPSTSDFYDGSVTLEDGFQIAAAGMGADATYSFTMASSHPGYQFLFSLQIDDKGTGPTPLSVTFYSNPLLGLSDSAIAASIELTLSQYGGSFPFDLSVAQFTIPDIQPGETLALDMTWSGSASTTPEPTSLLLVGSGIVGMSGLMRRCLRHRG